jgi:hypothetical protein
MINAFTNNNPKARFRFISIISLRGTFSLNHYFSFSTNLSLKKKALPKKEVFSFSTGFLFYKKKKCIDAERRDMD